jgi:Na+/proline symporter
VNTFREGGLSLNPVSYKTPPMTLLVFFILGLFFAGSPTAGEGMTAQRFMAARNERHAIGGQLFNAFIALSLRIIPLVGLGILCMSLFWHPDLVPVYGEAPENFTVIEDPAYAWGALIKASRLPVGIVGLLVATEVAAFMSTLSALINWGSSFLVNDIYRSIRPGADRREEIRASRLTSLFLFIFAAAVAALFVDDMVSWFLFINTAVVIFWLPLAYFRFFWSRFNVWGELAATVLGLPVSVLVWFVLEFDEQEEVWQGMGLLFAIALAVLVLVTLLTPAESRETLLRFFERCRPPAGWKRIRGLASSPERVDPSLGHMVFDSALGMLACLGLVMATNAVFIGNIVAGTMGLLAAAGCGAWLLSRLSTK